MSEGWVGRDIDTRTPSTARMYDYYLGGKHHYPADRRAAERVLATVPELRSTAAENRRFLQRAVQAMTAAGIRQFLDLGAGLPTQRNVHEVAQHGDPEARVVYVDNDPVTLAHAAALLGTDSQTAVIDADLRHPDQVLSHPDVKSLIDFSEPVGVLLVAVLHFVTEAEDPARVVATFREAMASGSYLAVSHAGAQHLPADARSRAVHASQIYRRATSTITLRSREQVETILDDFEVLDPGVVPLQDWRPDSQEATGVTALGYGAVAYRP